MPTTDQFRLPADLILTPVEELPMEVRKRFVYDKGDYAVTRSRARAPSRIINGSAAELLREFLSPSTVARAIVRFARVRGASPETTLVEAYPLLEQLLAGGLLVADGENADPTHGELRRGEFAGTWEIIEPIQVSDDGEVHQVKSGARTAILKIEGCASDSRSATQTAIRREARVLDCLQGTVAPQLIEAGEHEGRCYLAIEWCPGINAQAYAQELHRDNDRGSVLALCRKIAAAYVRLHARGFIHGDVHPRNILVDGPGEVRLIDFGHAVRIGDDDAPGRAGVSFFFEPEFAAAVLDKREVPIAGPAGEQYAVAALLYLLSTGSYYLDFSLEREKLLRQIVTETPRPFADQGIAPWPELEAILARALSKSPSERYATMNAMAAALADAKVTLEASVWSASTSAAHSLVERVCSELAVDGTVGMSELGIPKASVFFGAGGIARALYRLALLCDDAAHLAAADVWLTLAENCADSPEAFWDPASDAAVERVGKIAPFHTASGLAAMRALIANAQGDAVGARQATADFTRLAFESTVPESCDLALGRSGALLAAALLGDVLPDDPPERGELARVGGQMLDALWKELDASPNLARNRPNLGMAHGWSGYIYAALRFCRTFDHPHPPRVNDRLGEIADLGEPWGRGTLWRWNNYGADNGTMPGWCNGSAGFVQLFTLAHAELKEQRFIESAVGAAWNAWEGGDGNGTLCCGEAGRAYALVTLARHMGEDAQWLARARKLCERAVAAIDQNSEKPYSLFKGRVGVALLVADLDRPEAAAFPFFEDEGWR